MARLRDEMKVVPLLAWVLAVCMFVGLAVVLRRIVIPIDEDFAPWPAWTLPLFSMGVSLMMSLWVLLLGYVWADARRRNMRHVLWTFLAAVIPNAIGFILYFILRDPLPSGCPHCGGQVNAGFGFCPKCGKPLTQICPECRRAVEPVWSHCAHCGAALPANNPALTR